MTDAPHHVVVVGAGFGGLEAVHGLSGAGAHITLIDGRNYHLFQPLLYQVAAALLAPSEIAWPVRRLFQRRKDVATLLATVTGIDTAQRLVKLADGGTIAYDTLVLATGARHTYFRHDEWEAFAPGLKTLEDATAIRGRILSAFEKAEREADPARRAALLTFVIVGGGPTGVELAGTIVELAHRNLPEDFRAIDTRKARVVLVEAGPRLLASFDPRLAAYAQRALERMGVEVLLGRSVTECRADGVTLDKGSLAASVTIWAAGVMASPAAAWLGAPADRAGRIQVEPDLTVPGHPEIFAIGDTVIVRGWRTKDVPGVATAAKQQGHHVARTIRARFAGRTEPRPFRYRDPGILATIGRNSAVIEIGPIRLRGILAWWLWGLVHIYYLVSVRHRLSVVLSWLWVYLTGDRSARLITQPEKGPIVG